jgi:hypothetical protein
MLNDLELIEFTFPCVQTFKVGDRVEVLNLAPATITAVLENNRYEVRIGEGFNALFRADALFHADDLKRIK